MGEHAQFISRVMSNLDGDKDAQIAALVKALERMTQTFKPFTMKPIGGPGSAARIEQLDKIEAHAEACKILRAVVGRASETGEGK